MSAEEKIYDNRNEEITFKDIVLKVQEYCYELLKFWWILLIGAGLGFGFYLYKKHTTPITYEATLTFMLNDDGDAGAGSGMALILGSLGLPGGGNGKETNLEKILQLFTTRAVIDRALLTKITVDGNSQYMANHIIDTYGLENLLDEYGRSAWEESILDFDPNFRFKRDSMNGFAYEEKVMLKILYDNVIGNSAKGIKPLLVSSIDDDSGIMNVKVKTLTESLTIEMINTIYDRLSLFFIEKAVEKQQKTYDVLKAKNDSIVNALTSAEYKLADFNDRNRNLVTVKGYLKQRQLDREAKVLSIMYIEAVKNLEVSEFALKRRKPYVQLIDAPIRPLVPSFVTIIIGIIFSIIGGAVAIAFIVVRKTFRDAMKD